MGGETQFGRMERASIQPSKFRAREQRLAERVHRRAAQVAVSGFVFAGGRKETREKFLRGAYFCLGRLASERLQIGPAQTGRSLLRDRSESFRSRLGERLHHRAVQQEQRLRRSDGFLALPRDSIWIGEI